MTPCLGCGSVEPLSVSDLCVDCHAVALQYAALLRRTPSLATPATVRVARRVPLPVGRTRLSSSWSARLRNSAAPRIQDRSNSTEPPAVAPAEGSSTSTVGSGLSGHHKRTS